MQRRSFIVCLGCAGGALVLRGDADAGTAAEVNIRRVGGYVGRHAVSKAVGNVSLNGNSAADDVLMRQIAVFTELTDLSLEGTRVGDAGIASLAKLTRVEWLNLYQTDIGDKALRTIGAFAKLEQLPIGETKITDAGLTHLLGLKSLHYLGLRGTAVTDQGLKTVAKLPALRSLHLGETAVTDVGVGSIAEMKLVQLWLHDTNVSKGAVSELGKLKTLRKLWVGNTPLAMNRKAVADLQRSLPKCRIND